MDPLDAAALALPGLEVRVVRECTSTNDLALASLRPSALLVVAESQTAGRGRRGRRWHSAPGAGVTFSLGRRIERPARELAAVSLVAGVAVARALHSLGLDAVRLKWPNDLVVQGAKLGGILVESRDGHVVIGIGINCRRTAGLERRVRRPVAYLEQWCAVPRNVLIRKIAAALLAALEEFERHGLAALRAEWEAMDAHAGRRLRVRLPNGRVVSGMASGIGADGSLQLSTRRGLRAVTSGTVVS